MTQPRTLNPLPAPDLRHRPITGDRSGRPDVPWHLWETHCRVARNAGVIMICNHPVMYRGNRLYQCCGQCPKGRK